MEIIGEAGEPARAAGTYACTLCGHREHFAKDQIVPPDHHPGHPWTMMVRDD